MFKSTLRKQFILILILVVFLALTANPYKFSNLTIEIPGFSRFWNWMQESKISLGLDLQGGTQLDYEIDLRDAQTRNSDDESDNDVSIPLLLSGVKDVIERRVNSLGVSEANIYLATVGDEEHIVVELPGVKDIEEAKKRVGKVVQLEFKTEKGEATSEEIAAIEKQAQAFFQKVKQQKDLNDLEDFARDMIAPNQVEYKKSEKASVDDLPEDFAKILPELKKDTFYPKLLRFKEKDFIFNEGQVQQPEGFNIIRLIDKTSELKKKPTHAEDFDKLAKELKQPVSTTYLHDNEIKPETIKDQIAALETGEISDVLESTDGLFITKMMDKKLPPEETLIRARHILIKTESLLEEKNLKELPPNPTEDVKKQIEAENETIQKENADIPEKNKRITEKNEFSKKRAEEVLEKVKANPETFSELAKKFSEDSSAGEGGDLGFAKPDTYVEPFRNAALALKKGEFTQNLVQSIFGYHIIKLDDIQEKGESLVQLGVLQFCATCKDQASQILNRLREEDLYTVERLWFNSVPSPWQKTELDGRHFKRADVAYDQTSFRPYVAIAFDDEGAAIFEKLTEENVQKKIGIFVGGEFISSPVVQQKISGGDAQITLGGTNPQAILKEANDLAASLNAGSIPAPLKKPNELNIGASLGDAALAKSLRAGIIGIAIVSLFMIMYYRWLGVLASFAMSVYGLLLIFIVQSEMNPVVAFLMTFILWISFAFRLLKSELDFFAKTLFLSLSILGVWFIFRVLTEPIVLTLAGVAGILLSIGMAVDANILIFERMKEEFAQGKSFLDVVNDGFDRAWTSILDSNVSTLITCAILYSFGTSIIKGFAINLAVGIVVSMFTAITVTKTFILLCEGTRLEKIHWLWKRKQP